MMRAVCPDRDIALSKLIRIEVRIICACRSETVTMVFAINGFLSSVVTQRQANACTAMTHPSFASRTHIFSTVQQGSAWDL